MLFHSVEFIFLFLPLVLVVYLILLYYGQTNVALLFVICASLFFYARHVPIYVLLILSSVGFNYLIGRYLVSTQSRNALWVGVLLNLSLLSYFKYAGFLTENVNIFVQNRFTVPNIVLPLAISFFTFQQIAYLVDVYKNRGPQYSFLRYAFFVVFFPQLIAGPIVHHNELLPQLLRLRFRKKLVVINLSIGLTIFALGLAKKLLIADSVGVVADDVFSAVGPGNVPTFFDLWYGSLAFTLQIYFDFSGYSDMAIGLARMFGFKLPLNFYSPYKATSIVEFWRRWHMTLSRFLRDYLYIPLGGNRKGMPRQLLNVIIVMLLGGLWHGAEWGFVLWGALHAFYIIINYSWQKVPIPFRGTSAYSFAAWSLTFLAVIFAWVPFRSPDLATSFSIYRTMLGLDGINLGFSQYFTQISGEGVLQLLGILKIDGSGPINKRFWVSLGFIIIVAMPNVYEWVSRFKPALGIQQDKREFHYFGWRPNGYVAIGVSALACFSILSQSKTVEFLYFQF